MRIKVYCNLNLIIGNKQCGVVHLECMRIKIYMNLNLIIGHNIAGVCNYNKAPLSM